MRRISSIQCLRGIAALSVVIFHEFDSLNAFSPVNIDELTGRLHVLGTIGVDIFFCISGFIMVVLLARTDEANSRGRFALRRAVRILPTYWLLTLLMYGVHMTEAMRQSVSASVSPEWGFLLGSLLVVPMRDARGIIYPLLSPGWTLSFEIFFYLVLACLIGRKVGTITAIVGVLFAGLVGFGVVAPSESPVLLFITSPLLIEFVFGMLIGLAFLAGAPRHPWWGALCVLLCGVVLALTYADFIRSDTERLLLRGVPAALLVLGAVCLEERFRSKLWRPWLVLGDCSYALYLTHDFVLPAVNRIAAGRLEMPLARVAWMAVAASLLVGWSFFRVVERPLIRRLTPLLAAGGPARPRQPEGKLAEPVLAKRPRG
jgi:exopolysaccharide production protein ExoZ